MSSPSFVADFDSATGLLRAVVAALDGEPHLRLGRSRPAAAAVRASTVLPERLRTGIFATTGGREAIRPGALVDVDPDAFADWVVKQYPQASRPAVAIGSSNGALSHLWAATGVPWLPQTFLVPLRRNSDPDDCLSDAHLAASAAAALLSRRPDLQIHQMHDPNQDRLMVRRLAYFRMKLRGLPAAYRTYLRSVLPPGGTIIIVNCERTWPVSTVAERHFYQQGAVGGLRADEYVEGSRRVADFLARQGSSARQWTFPPVDGHAPEAEWGYEPHLTEALAEFAAEHGYQLAELRFPDPESTSPLVADLFADWYATAGAPSRRLLAETFICVEPTWTLHTRTVPLWLTFGTQPSLATLEKYLDARKGRFDELLVTLFPHGVRSAGYSPASDWLNAGRKYGLTTMLAGARESQWPADFAALVNYADHLHRIRPLGSGSREPMPLEYAVNYLRERGADHSVDWRTR